MLYGYPQDWIRFWESESSSTIKDFSFSREPRHGQSIVTWCPLGEGDVDWTAVYEALHEAGYQGTATLELDPGEAAYLKEMRRRFGLTSPGRCRRRLNRVCLKEKADSPLPFPI